MGWTGAVQFHMGLSGRVLLRIWFHAETSGCHWWADLPCALHLVCHHAASLMAIMTLALTAALGIPPSMYHCGPHMVTLVNDALKKQEVRVHFLALML